MLEEKTFEEARPNNDIVYIRVDLHGVPTEVMIDTGANVSLIDRIELKRIQENNTEKIPTLPINHITICLLYTSNTKIRCFYGEHPNVLRKVRYVTKN